MLLEEEVNIKIVDLPKGLDPDLFVRKFGIKKFENLIENALQIFDYKLKVLNKTYNQKKLEDKAKIALEMLSMIKRIKNEILKSEYIKLLSEKIDVNESTLLKEFNKIKLDQPARFTSYSEEVSNSNFPKAEKMLIKLLLDDTGISKELKNFIEPADLQDKRLQKILELVFNLNDSCAHLKPNQIISHLDDEKCINLISELSNEETLSFENKDKEIILNDCIKRIKSNSINLRCQNLQERIKTAQLDKNSELISELMKEFNFLIKERGKINEKNRN
jgi:DNA primase